TMEASRQERKRRESTKATAAPILPSSQDQAFNLRLVELYYENPVLWNTLMREHFDVGKKSRAWEKISAKLGNCLNPAFIRSRVSHMRHQVNVYRLLAIEYEATPGVGTRPVKPYYADSFKFLDSLPGPNGEMPKKVPETEDSEQKDPEKDPDLSTSSGVIPGTSKIRYSDYSIIEMVRERLKTPQKEPLNLTMPHLSLTRLQRSLIRNRGLEPRSPDSNPDTTPSGSQANQSPPSLQAQPGVFISKTKLAHIKGKRRQSEPSKEEESEDEELYRFHWSVRKQQRSLRP
ncbi:hypothetical protein KR009_004570, partial [Drosophila setifemur]